MKVVIATGNAGKLCEFARILTPLGFDVIGLKELGLALNEEETGTTFEANAMIKAAEIHCQTGLTVLADDSGLCVDALGGRPGVYSARYGGEDLPYDKKIDMLLEEIADKAGDERSASFECAIAMIAPDGTKSCYYGSCKGEIGHVSQGEHGFGYDPIFYVNGRSFAQISDDEKDIISHRGKALRAMAQGAGELINKNR